MKVINLTPNDNIQLVLYEDKIRKIREVVCNFYGVSIEDCQGNSRKDKIMKARKFSEYFPRDIYGLSVHFSIIGYVLNPDNPKDHASVRHNYTDTLSKLNDKTRTGKFVNVDLRNECQTMRGLIIYELDKMDSLLAPLPNNTGRVSIYVGSDIVNRLSLHCKNTGMSKSHFVRAAIINALNTAQNVV